MENNAPASPVLRAKAAAVYLDLTEQALANMRVDGKGPVFTRIGRSVRYLKADLDAYLAANRRRSTSDTGAQPCAA
jgi:predicted DNA-binding transcriptional regulator AlpA